MGAQGGKGCCGCDTQNRNDGDILPMTMSRNNDGYGDAPNQAGKDADGAGNVRLPAAAGGEGKSPQGKILESGKPDGAADGLSSNYFDREATELRGDGTQANNDSVRKFRQHTFRTGAKYEGQWLGQERDGFGVQQWPDGAAYEGQWQKDCAAGQGLFRHSNGDIYIGLWRGNVAHGLGTYRHQGERTTYEGQFCDDLQDGTGVETWAEGARFEGQFNRGKKHGFGVYLWPDGSQYAGQWSINQIEGTGEYIGKDGRRFAGEWDGSVMHGVGRSTWPDGRSYEGQYARDQKDGFGVFAWTDGRRYEGYWRGGRQHGHGRLCLEDGSTRLAEWTDGTRIH